MKRNFIFNWRVTLFSVLCLAAFTYLGVWQMQRAQEKELLIAERAALKTRQPVSADLLVNGQVPPGQAVRFTGTWDTSVTLLLDNRVLGGKVGFEVHQVFRDNSGQSFIVNRGFVPMGRTREDLPDIPGLAEENVTMTGEIYQTDGQPLMLADETRPNSGFPAIVQLVDTTQWREVAGPNLFPQVIRLREGEPGALPRHWPDTVMQPVQHRGYSAQWFTMALAVLLVWIFFSFRKENEHDRT
jgi:cytochrome oxidase assembly protein ShyY1